MRRNTGCVCVCAALVGLLVFLHLWLLDGLDGVLLGLLFEEDTAYTAGYSDSAFRAVRIGMTEEEVHALLGPPQCRWVFAQDGSDPGFGARWSHSPGDTHYRCRVILFYDGKVAEKHTEFYVD